MSCDHSFTLKCQKNGPRLSHTLPRCVIGQDMSRGQEVQLLPLLGCSSYFRKKQTHPLSGFNRLLCNNVRTLGCALAGGSLGSNILAHSPQQVQHCVSSEGCRLCREGHSGLQQPGQLRHGPSAALTKPTHNGLASLPHRTPVSACLLSMNF